MKVPLSAAGYRVHFQGAIQGEKLERRPNFFSDIGKLTT
jgi:hypothetical protein